MLKNRDTLKPFALSLYASDFDGYSSVPLVIKGATDKMIVKARVPDGIGIDEFLFGAERKSTFKIGNNPAIPDFNKNNLQAQIIYVPIMGMEKDSSIY
jgi:hypothetical protein